MSNKNIASCTIVRAEMYYFVRRYAIVHALLKDFFKNCSKKYEQSRISSQNKRFDQTMPRCFGGIKMRNSNLTHLETLLKHQFTASKLIATTMNKIGTVVYLMLKTHPQRDILGENKHTSRYVKSKEQVLTYILLFLSKSHKLSFQTGGSDSNDRQRSMGPQ